MSSIELQVGVASASRQGLDVLGVDALVLLPCASERPLRGVNGYCDWRLNGRLSRMLEQGVFSAQPEEALLTDTRERIGAERIFLFGQGDAPGDFSAWRDRFLATLPTLQKAGVKTLATELPPSTPAGDLPAQAREVRRCLALIAAALPQGKVVFLTDSPHWRDLLESHSKLRYSSTLP